MPRNNDYRTKKEKFYDFMHKNRYKIIVCSLIVALIICFVSLVVSNKGGLFVIIFYPLALIFFIWDLHTKIDYRQKFHFSIFLSFATIFMFVLGFFVEI